LAFSSFAFRLGLTLKLNAEGDTIVAAHSQTRITSRGFGEPFVAQWATSLLAMLGRAEVQVELGADDHTPQQQR
jgi:hypothetical protein